MSSVSLCMIVKNEEAVLARCLRSVRDLVDEIIVVDTGSSDRTREIAAEFTDKIYDFPWVYDFSAARNFSFSKATKSYVMWMDADDVFDSSHAGEFLELKNSGFHNADMIMMPYQTAFDEDGNPTFTYYRERVLRREFGFYWKGRVHEALVCGDNDVPERFHCDIPIIHRSVKTGYSDRNLNIYEKQIADGEVLTARDIFYYGRELFYHQKYDAAILCLEHFLDEKDAWIENMIEACKVLSYCYRAKDDMDAALSVLLRTLTYDKPRAEICCEIGALLMHRERFSHAVFWYELALTIPRDDHSGAFVSADCYGYTPYIQLCVCWDRLGDHKKAEEYNSLAGECRPHSPAYLQNLEYFKALRER